MKDYFDDFICDVQCEEYYNIEDSISEDDWEPSLIIMTKRSE